MDILGQAKLNRGIVAIEGQTFYTRAYLSRKFERHMNTIIYYQRRGIIPRPKSYLYSGGVMYLWSRKDLKTIATNLKQLSLGRYRKDKHPILDRKDKNKNVNP